MGGITKTPNYRIGVDVGGTNTDAVLISLAPMRVLASHKAPTTPDVTTGITEAVRAVLAASKLSLDSIGCVIIGTTHFVNAVVQRSASLQRVSVVRLCGGNQDGFGINVPPFVDFPKDLEYRIKGPNFFCNGGYQISGIEISPLDVTELEQVAVKLVNEGVTDIVISGIYSPLNPEHEIAASKIVVDGMRRVATSQNMIIEPRVTLSHQISSIGFLARENAAILNATLRPLAEITILGFQQAMMDIFQGLPTALYLTQNDGSVLGAADSIDLPIRTFNSGPTNSIRGGEFLWQAAHAEYVTGGSERKDALVVVDIGGTTSDSGLLLPNGLPRMSSVTSLVGGVRTNFALPALESIGLGGGSIVRGSGENITVGPDSVALELTQKAQLFGGDVLTTTDIIAASELHSPSEHNPLGGMGHPERLRNVSGESIRIAKKKMRQIIEELVDRTKTQKGDVDVLIVGGGAIIIDTAEPLSGVRAVRKVKGGNVANAVGAAMSRVSGVVDTVVDTSNQTIKEAQEVVSELAIEAALKNGAQHGTVEVAEVAILPIQYVDAKARIVIRAVGTLDVAQQKARTQEELNIKPPPLPPQKQIDLEHPSESIGDPLGLNIQTYEPKVEAGQWLISALDLEFIAEGCRVLGCGGGGDPYQEFLKVRALIEESPGSVKVVSPTALPDGALIGWTGCLGSPEVSMERMEADECNKAHDELTRVMGYPPADAFLALEIGGGNGVVNLGVSAAHGKPCVDADLMGRAYPTDWQTTFNVYGTARGESLVPATIASGDGSFMTMTSSRTDKLVDRVLRAATVEMGCRAGKAGPPKPAKVMKEQAILNTVSLAWWIGRAISLEKTISDKAKRIIDEVGGADSARILAEGKITSVERVLKTGHTYGVVEVDGTVGDGSKSTIRIPFKNENAFVEATAADGQVSILASVPDLIAVLDAETGSGLGTPEYKYGLKVTVIAIAASPRWTETERGLELGGPVSMGFPEVEYKPIGKYSKPRSVIEVYSKAS